MSILVHDILNGTTTRYNGIAEVNQRLGISRARIVKYLDSPELGDWPTNGVYLRSEFDLDKYPWRHISTNYLQAVSRTSTPSKLMFVYLLNGRVTSHHTLTDIANAYNISSSTVRELYSNDGALVEGRELVLRVPVGDIYAVGIQYNPRVKNPNAVKSNEVVRSRLSPETTAKLLNVKGVHIKHPDYTELKVSIPLNDGTRHHLKQTYHYNRFGSYDAAVLAALQDLDAVTCYRKSLRSLGIIGTMIEGRLALITPYRDTTIIPISGYPVSDYTSVAYEILLRYS